MPKRFTKPTKISEEPCGKPARNQRERDEELISLSYNLVEKRIREGTATSQETTHFLKLAQERNSPRNKVLEKKIELMDAQIRNLKAQDNVAALYAEAIHDMRYYSGRDEDEEDEDAED